MLHVFIFKDIDLITKPMTGKLSGPGIEFKKLPVLAFEVLRENATAATPGIIKIMRAHFKGDPAYIPELPDPALLATTIPFDKIKKGAAVRCVALDRQRYMAVYDLVQIFTGKPLGESVQVWRRLGDDVKKELEPFIKSFAFCGNL